MCPLYCVECTEEKEEEEKFGFSSFWFCERALIDYSDHRTKAWIHSTQYYYFVSYRDMWCVYKFLHEMFVNKYLLGYYNGVGRSIDHSVVFRLV